ncbi:MAG: hypothetical protein M3Y62_05450 [Candidatus Dormibacteraeota bacterium]|nr:hypothetical protein [Candidatus Dormibacteraeota bacterium]
MAGTQSGGRAAGKAAVDASVVASAALSARRLVPALDFTGPTELITPNERLNQQALDQTLQLSVTHFYDGLLGLKNHIDLIVKDLPKQQLPAHLVGTLLQPTGTAAARIQLELELPDAGLFALPPRTLTNDDGTFTILLPRGAVLAQDATLTLTARGNDGVDLLQLGLADIGATGLVGERRLNKLLAPLPVSIVASLKALIEGRTSPTGMPAPAPVTTMPLIHLGEEDGVCSQIFGPNAGIDRFPYSVLFRLVEPRASVLNRVIRFPLGDGGRILDVLARSAQWTGQGNQPGAIAYVDRVAVDQPISVDGFRDQLIGVGNGTVVNGEETVPMAGTLGLGYVVRMAQRWQPMGLTLGNLVYSLPLAPGEQQRVAVFERRDVTSVREAETLDVVEQQSFQQAQDTSAHATFNQAFSEMAKGGSQFDTSATSESLGFNLLIASGGGGSAQSHGTTSSWMEGQRDVASQAAEQTHASVERQAAARRSAQRTSMRLASASESGDVTTKVITNHNHTRALTLQYWEVVRLFETSSSIEGVTLVCMVPLEVIRFLPAGQNLSIDATIDKKALLARYAEIAKNSDVLTRALPRPYQYGMTLLNEFVADPRATVDTSTATAEDVIHFELHGTFLPFEQIYVSAMTRRGTRIGPVRLTGVVDPVGHSVNLGFLSVDLSFSSENELFGALRARRSGEADYRLTASMALPPSLARNDVVGFEITRDYRPFDYSFVSTEAQTAAATAVQPSIFGTLVQPVKVEKVITRSAHFTPDRLEQELGGPFVWQFSATIQEAGGVTPPPGPPSPNETYATNYIDRAGRLELPPGALPIPARELAPVLRFSAILQIEKTLQHIVHNTVAYSKVVWSSLTPEERAIMLEGFTIGVPNGGIVDGTQQIPLLNCVTNQVLGYFGNAMIMPFMIPLEVAESQGITSGQIQDALTNFHRVGFDPPTSRVGLPTRGVLGEAVLGHCPSAEKIDLTRFWNWADSPADTAPTIADVQVPTTQPSQAAGLTAPNTLTGMAPLITNFNNSPAIPVETGLMQGLISAGAGQKDFTGLTNAAELAGLVKTSQTTAESARADALKRATELQSQAMTEIGNYFGAKGGEAYAANYRPAGGGDGSKGSDGTTAGGTTPGGTTTGETGGPTSGGTTTGGTTTGGTTTGGTTTGGTTTGGTTTGGTTTGGTTSTFPGSDAAHLLSIYFNFDQRDFPDTTAEGVGTGQNQALETFMTNAIAARETAVTVRGYASPEGDQAHNVALAQQRADSVKARLDSRLAGVVAVGGGTLTGAPSEYPQLRRADIFITATQP